MAGGGIEKIQEKIGSFQRKYYLNVSIRGIILTLAITFFYFVLATLLEHNLWLGTGIRLSIFALFFLLTFYCIYLFLKDPIKWWFAKKGLNQEESAKLIGSQLPSVKDRLLNLLQLSQQENRSSLAYASIKQKAIELEPLSFDSIIDLGQNKRYLKFLIIPVVIILSVLIINQKIITDSADRIIHFNQHFSPEAPFDFVVQNKNLKGFYNEDFELKTLLKGTAVPEEVYIQVGSKRFKMQSHSDHSYSYTVENIQEGFSFQLEAAGFYSTPYTVEVIKRPELTGFEIELEFPSYIHRKNEKIENAGNMEVPEGTTIKWSLGTSNAEHAEISFLPENKQNSFQSIDNKEFTFTKRIKDPVSYEIILENVDSKNKDRIAYQIEVQKDEHPQIAVNNFRDSILYRTILLGGVLNDDYGITQLKLHYRILNENKSEVLSKSIPIGILKNQAQQSFIYNWSLDSLQLKPNHHLEYYLEVWDNDGVNGRKSTRSATYNFLIPTKDQLIGDIKKSENQTQNKIDESAAKSSQLQDKIEEASQRLKGKQNLDWQDKKMLEDILKQKNNLNSLIDQMQKENKELLEKKDAFTEQDERIKEKAEQIQKLMEEILDDETKKLFEELEKLMKENTDVSQLQKLLDQLRQNTNSLEKELDRMLELFKELQFESKFDQLTKKLEEQVDKQKELQQKTEAAEKEDNTKKNKTTNEERNSELAKEQQKLNEEFKETMDEMEDLKELGEELEQSPADVPKQKDMEEIQQEMQDSQDNLRQNQPSKSNQSQQKAIKEMQKVQQQMAGAMNSMSMEIDMQNLEMLRQIIHGLIKLSYDQEGLMKSFNELQENDPRFNALAEEQLRLKDNAKVLEDSLLSLSKRDPFMGSIVTKEINELNNHLDNVTESNKEKKRPQAQSHMQLSMTSINNLALMLDSHFDSMMQMMANAKSSGKKKSKQKSNQPNLSQLQQQLNQKIQDLKNGSKSGRELSEELAKMAAEQERIRKAIQEMQDKMKEGGKMPGGDLPSQMEQTELDLVNKQLTDQLIRRQQEILTRLLETEKSMREQELDEERKGESAKDYEKELPKAFEEYLRLKEKEVELLKTVPPKLYPYYKKEVDQYFKRMANP